MRGAAPRFPNPPLAEPHLPSPPRPVPSPASPTHPAQHHTPPHLAPHLLAPRRPAPPGAAPCPPRPVTRLPAPLLAVPPRPSQRHLGLRQAPPQGALQDRLRRHLLHIHSSAAAATAQPPNNDGEGTRRRARQIVRRRHNPRLQMVGKALFDGQLLDVHFTRSFYKRILGVKVTYHDIEAIDPDYYKNLKWMLENDISDVLDLIFSMDADEEKLILYERDEVTDCELIPDGRNIRVTEENKLDDLRTHTEYSGYYNASPVIQWFWEVVQGFSEEDKVRFLQFVTGTSKVPLEGFSALQGISGSQRFQIHKAYGSTNQFPSAHKW